MLGFYVIMVQMFPSELSLRNCIESKMETCAINKFIIAALSLHVHVHVYYKAAVKLCKQSCDLK